MSIELSVIIPTFQRAQSLLESIKSVLQESAVPLEVIVVDDCPRGSAESIVRGLGDDRVTYVRNLHPSGERPGLVRNLGWPLAKGKYVHFLDDDDLVPIGHYSVVRDAFSRHPNVGVIFGRIETFGENAEEVKLEQAYFNDAARRAARSQLFGARRVLAAQMFFMPVILVCGAAVIRRECISALAGFNESMRLLEDSEFFARAIRRFGARFIDSIALHYRIGNTLSNRPGIEQLMREYYVGIHSDYRREWGTLDYYAMKIAARTLLRAL